MRKILLCLGIALAPILVASPAHALGCELRPTLETPPGEGPQARAWWSIR